MASLRVGWLAFLASFGQVLGLVGKERVQPPHNRNVALVSKDFKLFVTWQPAGDSSEVSYTVKWRNAFANYWSTTHCVDISATSCDITCVYPKPSNRFQVQVEALERTGRISERGQSGFIEYAMLVEPAPPVLQVRQAERVLVVNTTFTYPSCLKDFFQDLSYDLEFWENGATGKPKKLHNLMEEVVVNINRTVFSGGSACFRAQAFLLATGKRSNFSEPVCVQLLQDKEESWRLIVLLFLLLLLLLAVGATIYCSWYKNVAAKFKTPQALDFSSYKGPPRFLEVGERERIKADVLVCEKVPVVSEIRRRPAPQINSPLTPVFLAEEEEEDEDEEDNDDSGSPIPYTELRSQKKGMNCQGVDTGQKALTPSSGSESSQSDGGGGFPDVMVSKPFVPTELVTGESVSDSQGTSLSGSSSAEEPLACSVGCPAATRGGQEDMSGDLDFSVQLSTLTQGHDVSLPTETRFMAATDFPEGSWGNVEDSQMPLLRTQGHQDTRGILLEERTKEERGFENASCSGCGRLMKEILLLKASSIEGLESCSLGGNRNSEEGSIPGPKFCGYLPKHTHYISKT